jgi:hypothetical protein
MSMSTLDVNHKSLDIVMNPTCSLWSCHCPIYWENGPGLYLAVRHPSYHISRRRVGRNQCPISANVFPFAIPRCLDCVNDLGCDNVDDANMTIQYSSSNKWGQVNNERGSGGRQRSANSE